MSLPPKLEAHKNWVASKDIRGYRFSTTTYLGAYEIGLDKGHGINHDGNDHSAEGKHDGEDTQNSAEGLLRNRSEPSGSDITKTIVVFGDSHDFL